jgi:hypothetical protein
MSLSETIYFCDNCDNIMDVRKNILKPAEIIASENTETEQKIDIDYKTLLDKVSNNEKLTHAELKSIDLKDLFENKHYKSLVKKGEVKKIILNMIEEMGNTDENINAYFYCNNCCFSKKIENETKILTKHSSNTHNTHNEYTDPALYKNKVFASTMPITRNFVCPNDKCDSNTGKKPTEAIFFRENKDSYKLIHVCKVCLTIKY